MRGRGAPRRYCRHRAPTSRCALPQVVVGSDLQPQLPRQEPRADSGAQWNAAAALLQLPSALLPGIPAPAPRTLAAAEPLLGIPTVTAPLAPLGVSPFSASQ